MRESERTSVWWLAVLAGVAIAVPAALGLAGLLGAGGPERAEAALTEFRSCRELLRYVEDNGWGQALPTDVRFAAEADIAVEQAVPGSSSMSAGDDAGGEVAA